MNNVFYEFVAFHYAMAHPDLMSVLKLEFFTEPTLRNIFPLV